MPSPHGKVSGSLKRASLSPYETRNLSSEVLSGSFLLPAPLSHIFDISHRIRGRNFNESPRRAEWKTADAFARLNIFPPGIKAAMGYRLGRRLMIPLAAVFAGILQHSHSTGFRSGATARIISRPPRSAASLAEDRVRCRARCILAAASAAPLFNSRKFAPEWCAISLSRFRAKRYNFNWRIFSFLQ